MYVYMCIDYWLDRLPVNAYSISYEQIDFLLSESVWDFLMICWTKYQGRNHLFRTSRP